MTDTVKPLAIDDAGSWLTVENEFTGVVFACRWVPAGMPHGSTGSVVEHCDVVEFYDTRHADKFGGRGQLVSRYFSGEMFNLNCGLSLMGGVPDWSITSRNMVEVQAWLLAVGLCPDCFESQYGFNPSMGDPVNWNPGNCAHCATAGLVFRVSL